LSYQPKQLLISTSDERSITYELDGSLITRADYSFQPSSFYTYNEKGHLTQKALPGRATAIEYDAFSRVTCLIEQLANSDELLPSNTLFDRTDITEVINAIGKKTIY